MAWFPWHTPVKPHPPGIVTAVPGYPLLVALAIQLGGDENGYKYVLLIQALLGALSVALTIAIARQWLSFAYSLTAGILVAVWPHLVAMSGFVLTETFFGFSLVLGVYLLTCAIRRKRAGYYIAAGLVFAYSTLINPSILLFTPIATVALYPFQRKHLVIFLCCSLGPPAAWSIYSTTLDADKSSSSRLVENILAGSEPNFSYDYSPETVASRARITTEMARYQDDVQGALGMVVGRFAEDPALYASWYFLQKPAQFWQWAILGDSDIYVYPVLTSPFHTQPFYRVIISLCSSINTLLMAAALAFVLVLSAKLARRRFRARDLPLLIVSLVFVYATLLHSVLTPDPRYATPFRPFEILLALTLLSMAHSYVRESRQGKEEEGSQSLAANPNSTKD